MKKRILVTDTAPLYPPLWGGPKRIWNLYSSLSQELFDITYVGASCALGKGVGYKVNRISNNFKEILSAPPPHYYPWHVFERKIFKNTSLDLFFYLLMHTDWQFKYILNSQNADIVICSHPWPSLAFTKKNGQFFIYDAHNCEYLLMDQILQSHPLKKLVLRQVRKIEEDACRKSDLILACSENEKKDLINLYRIDPDKIIVIYNGTNIPEKEKNSEKRKAYRKNLSMLLEERVVIFIGAYYKPNIDAVKFIIDKIAPILTDFKFLIVGTVSDFFKEVQLPKNVIFLGKILDEELDLALRTADIAINPMFDGSGINIKMLDYMAYGLPIVTTECGARGIEINNSQPMIISHADKFADNIKLLNVNNILYSRMSESGTRLVAERYDWKNISSNLENIILRNI